MHSTPSDDLVMEHLQRHQQVNVFRLQTGQCRLRALLYRLGLSHIYNSRLSMWDRPTNPRAYFVVLHLMLRRMDTALVRTH